jgi:hypothetical protein
MAFNKNPDYITTVGLTGGFSVLGWIFAFLGIIVSQARFNQIGLQLDKNPFSLTWFFILYHLIVVIALNVANSKGSLSSTRQTVRLFVDP